MKSIILALLSSLIPCLSAAPKWQVVYNGTLRPNGAQYTILDGFEFSSSDVSKCNGKVYAYFSAHYEDWRGDESRFGKKLRPISGWDGERYIQWDDPKNLAVMRGRIDLAKRKGFDGIDWDNVDGPFGKNSRERAAYAKVKKDYFAWLIRETKKAGLEVGLKNSVDAWYEKGTLKVSPGCLLALFGNQVDFFVSEATVKAELEAYRRYGKPTVRMINRRRKGKPGWVASSLPTPSFIYPAWASKDGNKF